MKALEILRNANVFDSEYLAWNKYIKIDEAIAELEALQSRSCYTCKWKNTMGEDEPCDECSESYNSKWEAK